jgi:hypothetical protein
MFTTLFIIIQLSNIDGYLLISEYFDDCQILNLYYASFLYFLQFFYHRSMRIQNFSQAKTHIVYI